MIKMNMKLLFFVGIAAMFIAMGFASAGLNEDNSTDQNTEDIQIINRYCENSNGIGISSGYCYRYRYRYQNGTCEGNGSCNGIANSSETICSGDGGLRLRDGTGNQDCGVTNGKGYGSGRCRHK